MEASDRFVLLFAVYLVFLYSLFLNQKVNNCEFSLTSFGWAKQRQKAKEGRNDDYYAYFVVGSNLAFDGSIALKNSARSTRKIELC